MTLADQVVDAVHRVDFGLVPYREPHFALPILDLEPVARASSNPAVRERAGNENAAELMQLGYQTGAVIGSIEFAARQILETVEREPQRRLDGFGRDWLHIRLEFTLAIVDIHRPSRPWQRARLRQHAPRLTVAVQDCLSCRKIIGVEKNADRIAVDLCMVVECVCNLLEKAVFAGWNVLLRREHPI